MTALSMAADLVREHEGCRLEAYQDQGGVWTIGWGHTGPEVREGLSWTQAQADAALAADLSVAAKRVSSLVSVALARDEQIAALIDFDFNAGSGAFASSTLRQKVNAHLWTDAAHEFIRWDHIGQDENKGLLLRRLEEAALFLKGC